MTLPKNAARVSGRIDEILPRLFKAYGRPKLFPRYNPVDELVKTILSQNTTDKNSLAAFALLKKAFPHWENILAAPVEKIAGIIGHAGLARIKSARIKDVLAGIKKREGEISLARLKNLPEADALNYLRSFNGVGPKTAACVLLFSFRMPVMPVDTHIFRVTKRLGLLAPDTTPEEAHAILSSSIPKNLIYASHLCIIEHGRRTCKAQNPRCERCAVFDLCRFPEKAAFKRKHVR